MTSSATRMDVRRAVEDIRRRTLARMPRPLDQMVYLASMRDYNTGLYYHDGLAATYTQEVASEALAECHQEAFRQLLDGSLEQLVGQLESYAASIHTHPRDFIATWKKLEPYRVTVPVETEPLSAELLFSNLKIALAILEFRSDPRQRAQGASPLPSPCR